MCCLACPDRHKPSIIKARKVDRKGLISSWQTASRGIVNHDVERVKCEVCTVPIPCMPAPPLPHLISFLSLSEYPSRH